MDKDKSKITKDHLIIVIVLTIIGSIGFLPFIGLLGWIPGIEENAGFSIYKNIVCPIMFIIQNTIVFFLALTLGKDNSGYSKDKSLPWIAVMAVISCTPWFIYLIPGSISQESPFYSFFTEGVPSVPGMNGITLMLVMNGASIVIALVNKINQQWISALLISLALFSWTQGRGMWEGESLFYLIMTAIIMVLFWNTGLHNVINIYYIIIGVLFPISAVLPIVFPTMPIISDTIGSFLTMGIKSAIAMLFLIASFTLLSGERKTKKANIFTAACFLTNAVIYFLELTLLPMYDELTPIMKQVYQVVNLQGLGIFLTIVGFVAYLITMWYGAASKAY